MTDANVRIPAAAKERLAQVAAAEGLSLRAYLSRLANKVLTPAERAERARQQLAEWTGYSPSPKEEKELDAELDRRLARSAA